MALPVEETTNQIESQQIKPNVGFWWEGKTGVPRKQLSDQSREPTKSILTAGQEIEPGPHRWKVRALTTALLILLSKKRKRSQVQVTVLSAFHIINVMCKRDEYTYEVKHLPIGEQAYIRYTLVKQQQKYI